MFWEQGYENMQNKKEVNLKKFSMGIIVFFYCLFDIERIIFIC